MTGTAVEASRDDLTTSAPADSAFDAARSVIAAATTRGRVSFAGPSELRGVDFWFDGSSLVVHAVATDTTVPTRCVLAAGPDVPRTWLELLADPRPAGGRQAGPVPPVTETANDLVQRVVTGRAGSGDRAVVVVASAYGATPRQLVRLTGPGVVRWGVGAHEAPIDLVGAASATYWGEAIALLR